MLEVKELNVKIVDEWREPQKAGGTGLDGALIVDLLSQFDLFGVWRKDIETALTYWSSDIFEIYGWPYQEGPVDARKEIEAYHPEDRALVLDCIAEAASRKTGFRFVLRLRKPDGTYKLVQANGRYRVNEQGREELYGTLSQFKERVRSVAINSSS